MHQNQLEGIRGLQAQVTKAKSTSEDDPLNTSPAVSEVARKALAKASDACRRIGWFSFWAQLTLSIISACILLFSVAFTSQVGKSCPGLAALCITLVHACMHVLQKWTH